MHVVFLTSEYPQPNIPHGGVGTFVQTIARELVKLNFRISVLGINRSSSYEQLEDRGVEIYLVPKNKIRLIGGLINYQSLNKKLKEIHKNNPISIVESTEMGLSFIYKIPNVKYLIRLHGGHHFFAESENRGINWWKGIQEKRSFKNADVIIGVSQYVVDHTSKYIDFENKKRGVIFNPANLDRFGTADDTKIIPGRIFFAGTICEKKGIRQLVEAMPLIKKRIPAAHLVIAGKEWFYPKTKKSYTDHLKTYITNEVKDSIQIIGSIENSRVPFEIEKAEVCCYPSHMEAMPLAWIEVMSMGKTFVASKIGPSKELIEDGVTGLLCDPLSPKDIAEKIIFAVEHKEKMMKMAEKGRDFALENFATSKIVQQNIDFYKSLSV